MQRIFSTLGQLFHNRILILGVLSLTILSSLFIFIAAPSYAAPISTESQKLIQQEQLDQQSQVANQRAQEYEEQVEAAENPEKVYEKNLKVYKQANPDQNIVEKAVEGAKDLVDEATGNK